LFHFYLSKRCGNGILHDGFQRQTKNQLACVLPYRLIVSAGSNGPFLGSMLGENLRHTWLSRNRRRKIINPGEKDSAKSPRQPFCSSSCSGGAKASSHSTSRRIDAALSHLALAPAARRTKRFQRFVRKNLF